MKNERNRVRRKRKRISSTDIERREDRERVGSHWRSFLLKSGGGGGIDDQAHKGWY